MNFRVRLPGAIYRQARDKAGDDASLLAIIVQFVTDYATGVSIQSKGGHARAANLSPERREEIARTAALARHHLKK